MRWRCGLPLRDAGAKDDCRRDPAVFLFSIFFFLMRMIAVGSEILTVSTCVGRRTGC